MAHDSYPRGAGLGHDANRRRPGAVDFDFTLQHGSRAQRREIVRQLGIQARQGVPGAAEKLQQAQEYLRARTSRHWLVSLPGREPFEVLSPQRVTAHVILQQWPGAAVVALDA